DLEIDAPDRLRVARVVAQQRVARARLARSIRVAEPARQRVEIAVLRVEVGNRAVLDDAQRAREALQEVPALGEVARRGGRQQAELREARNQALGAVDVEKGTMVATVAQLQVLHRALDVEHAAAPALQIATAARLRGQLRLHALADAVDLR